MEDSRIEKLKELLDSGALDQATYDEIVSRWENGSEASGTEEKENGESSSGRQRSRRVNVSGVGKLSDVYTQEFRGSGSVHVDGYLDADRIDISGAGRVEGDIISSEHIDISGSARVSGSVTAAEMETSGSMRAESLKCNSIESSGSLRVERGIEAEKIDFSGSAKAQSIVAGVVKSSGGLYSDTITAEEAYISGKIQSKEVDSKRFEMELYGSSSRIDRLTSEIVEIRQAKKIFTGSAEIKEIICKRAHLEGVKSKRITGDELVIGDGCDIDYAEGKTIKVQHGARVKEKKEI